MKTYTLSSWLKYSIKSAILAYLCILVSGCTNARSNQISPLQQLPSPPNNMRLQQIRGQIGSWITNSNPSDAYVIGRPIRYATLSKSSLFNYQSGQSIRALVQPTGTWVIPIYRDQHLIALAYLDEHYEITSTQSLGNTNLSIVASYDDPMAEVWFIEYPNLPFILLFIRQDSESMALFYQDSWSLYQPLKPVGTGEFPAPQMMSALQTTVTQKCRILYIFWQC